MKLTNFKVQDYPDEFTPVPEGKYLAKIIDEEHKNNKSGTGEILALKLEIIDGDYAGRFLFDNINIVHKNDFTEKKARQKLATIGRALQIMEPQSTEEFHNLPLCVDVAHSEYNDNIYANVKKYYNEEEYLQELQNEVDWQ